MKALAVILIVVAIAGMVLSFYPSFGFRNGINARGNFNNTRGNFNFTRQTYGPSLDSSLGGILNFVQVGLWVVVLAVAALLFLKDLKKAKK